MSDSQKDGELRSSQVLYIVKQGKETEAADNSSDTASKEGPTWLNSAKSETGNVPGHDMNLPQDRRVSSVFDHYLDYR